MNEEQDIFERVKVFFTENPRYFGIFIILVGIFLLLAAIFNWEWIFRGSSYNTQKIEGINNMYGRGVARVFMGIGGLGAMLSGIIWIIFSK